MSFRRGVALSGFAQAAPRPHGGGAPRRDGAPRPRRRPENLPMPTFVQLRVTNLCNLRCKMCGQWGDTGIFRAQSGEDPTDGALERQRIAGAHRREAPARAVGLRPAARRDRGLEPDRQPLRRRALPLSRHPPAHRRDQAPRADVHGHHERGTARGPGEGPGRARHRLDRGLDRRAPGRARSDPRACRQLCEGRGGDPRRGALAPKELSRTAADGDGDPAGDGAQPRRDRARGRGAAPASARHDQRGPALVRPGERGRRVRAGHARGPRSRRRPPGRASSSTRPPRSGRARRR